MIEILCESRGLLLLEATSVGSVLSNKISDFDAMDWRISLIAVVLDFMWISRGS